MSRVLVCETIKDKGEGKVAEGSPGTNASVEGLGRVGNEQEKEEIIHVSRES